jgi:hypothetical protein
MTITNDEVSKRAREIWEREGRPEGRDMEHWLQAEAELRSDSGRTQSGYNLASDRSEMMKVSAGASTEEGNRKRSLRRAKA